MQKRHALFISYMRGFYGKKLCTSEQSNDFAGIYITSPQQGFMRSFIVAAQVS